jgi:hypothetical protein
MASATEYTYETCCVESDGDSINEMRWSPGVVGVSYRTMRRRCAGLTEWARSKGYDRWLPLKNDPHVAYYRSTFRGVPCYYLVWSGIEFIWTAHNCTSSPLSTIRAASPA